MKITNIVIVERTQERNSEAAKRKKNIRILSNKQTKSIFVVLIALHMEHGTWNMEHR